MSTSSSSPIGRRGTPNDATPPADPTREAEEATVEPTQAPAAGAALEGLQGSRAPRRAIIQPAARYGAADALTRQVPFGKPPQIGRAPSPEPKYGGLMDAVTPLWDLPQAQLLSDLDDLLGQAHDLPPAHNAALLTKIALQCGSADEEKTAFAVLDRVVTQATHLPVSYRVAVLEAVAQQMAYLGEDQSLEPQRLALFKRLTDQCAQMDGNAIPKLIDFLAQARRWLGQSEASDATFFTVCELVVKLQEQHRPEPLTVLAEYLLSVSERQQWLAFQAIADMPASDGDALVELTAKVRYMPLGVRAAAFDKALTTVTRWHPDDLADASFELSKAIPSFKERSRSKSSTRSLSTWTNCPHPMPLGWRRRCLCRSQWLYLRTQRPLPSIGLNPISLICRTTRKIAETR